MLRALNDPEWSGGNNIETLLPEQRARLLATGFPSSVPLGKEKVLGQDGHLLNSVPCSLSESLCWGGDFAVGVYPCVIPWPREMCVRFKETPVSIQASQLPR